MMVTSSSRPALAIDLDGTLVDVKRRDWQVYVDCCADTGLERIEDENRYWWLRRERWPVLKTFVESPLDAHAEFYRLRHQRLEEPSYLAMDTLIPGVKDVLRAAREDHDLYLVTAREGRQVTLAQLSDLGIIDEFVEVMVTHGDKTPFLKAIPNLKAVIGDTESDVRPAQALGVTSIAVSSGIRSKQRLEDLGPDHLLDDIRGLPGVLSSW